MTEYLTVPLSKGQVAKVDVADYAWVMSRAWHAQRARPNAPWYAVHRISRTNKSIAMHTFLTGWRRTDHKNRDGLDNRRENLREATDSQNMANRGAFSKHGYKGVFRQTNGRWGARVGPGSTNYLGTFDTIEEAAMAYDVAAKQRYGEFALLNFPELNAS